MAITITPDDIHIDNEEFYESMDGREIQEMIRWMIKDGHIKPHQMVEPVSVMEEHYAMALNKLALCFHQLSIEDQEIIKLMAKKVVI